MTVAESLTDDERMTLKAAAFGAVFLVSSAEPGLLSMVKESFAASDAFAGSTGLVNAVLTTGDLPRLGQGTPDEVEREALPALRRAVEILRAKAPGELDNYRDTVVTAALRTAGAAEGVDAPEAAALSKVRSALGRGD
ncbi:hypothetical protein [Micromonospora sp. NPDC049679]|uniref:hypothetical protein n=1 Tax=Micromonospora sp. NPDC049679 TaxID=3155920 RepID=UPI00340944D1